MSSSIRRSLSVTRCLSAPVRCRAAEWKGRCSDDDATFWTREMRHKLRYNIATGDTAAAREKNNDGVFWMMLEDFMTVRVSVCLCVWEGWGEGGAGGDFKTVRGAWDGGGVGAELH